MEISILEFKQKMMEEIVNEAETFEITDSERNLKRNIDAVANQTNGKF